MYFGFKKAEITFKYYMIFIHYIITFVKYMSLTGALLLLGENQRFAAWTAEKDFRLFYLLWLLYLTVNVVFIFVYVRRTETKEIISYLRNVCNLFGFCTSCDLINNICHEALSKAKVVLSYLSLNVIPIHST